MTYKTILRTIPATAALLGAGLFISPQAVFADAGQIYVGYSEEQDAVTNQLRELRGLMAQLNYDADQLQSMQRSSHRWETHASHLTQVKEHVNRIGDQFRTLESLRLMAAPWQQEAIDRTLPLASQVASSTSAAIDHLNDNHGRLHDPQYAGHLQKVGELSHDMHEILDAHLKINEARDKIEVLTDKLTDPAEI